jgi:L-cysteine S-thiosulfotransferase
MPFARTWLGLGLLASALAIQACAALPASANKPLPVQSLELQDPLTQTPGDPARGRSIVANRQVGLCLLCHTGPIAEERFQGNLAPSLAGAGQRWSAAQLRLRMVDASQFNPQTIMPSYARKDGLNRVSLSMQGAPILNPQQIEDVVAYLVTLRE